MRGSVSAKAAVSRDEKLGECAATSAALIFCCAASLPASRLPAARLPRLRLPLALRLRLLALERRWLLLRPAASAARSLSSRPWCSTCEKREASLITSSLATASLYVTFLVMTGASS
jgi:hypothetical protein